MYTPPAQTYNSTQSGRMKLTRRKKELRRFEFGPQPKPKGIAVTVRPGSRGPTGATRGNPGPWDESQNSYWPPSEHAPSGYLLPLLMVTQIPAQAVGLQERSGAPTSDGHMVFKRHLQSHKNNLGNKQFRHPVDEKNEFIVLPRMMGPETHENGQHHDKPENWPRPPPFDIKPRHGRIS